MTPSAEVYESALAAKLSYFCWYGALSEVTGAERDLIADFARKLGYRFIVAQVEHPSILKTGRLRHGILSAEVTWRNDGVAFCHQEILLRSALLDASGKVLVEKRQWPIHPIQTWTPDEPVVEPIELKVPEGFASKATLAVGMVTRTGRPINLALKENLPNHLYPIATVELRKSDYAGDPIIFSQSNTPADWSVTGDVKATVVARGGPTEKPFLRIGGPSLNEAWVFAVGKRMPALPGATYRFTGSIRVESLTTGDVPYLKFAFLDAKMEQINVAIAGRSRWRRVSGNRFPPKGLPWEEFNVTAIAPPGTVYAEIAVEKGAPQPAESVVGLQGLRVELLEAP
ncbi:MAG: DUF4832 domain-containing protein [Planctomycetes bacterium]|nr:DUF4832 domain-containing protein [Planctomycetota bacterium]